MSQLTTTEEVTDIQIQRENAAFELLQRQAKMFAASSLVPKEFQGNVANCAIGVNIAKRLGADPFMVLQNIDIIHGRPSFRATFLIAMVNASGRFEPLQFKVEGEGMKRQCIAWTKARGTSEVLEGPPVSMEMAKAEGWSTKTGSKWLTMPELMLRYRAAAFFARLYAPDITLGMMTAEEAADIVERDVTPPKREALKEPLNPFPAPLPAPVIPAESGDMFAAEVPAKPILDEVKAKLQGAKVGWDSIARTMLDNGIFEDVRNNPDDCTDQELKDVLAQWTALQKGGKA